MVDLPKKQSNQASDRYYYVLAFRVAADFGVTIAVPALLAVMAGKRLDEKFGTEPWILGGLLIAALTITVVIIAKKAKYYGELYEKGDSK
ncbi:AtpZ/AtpI family protein [Candidatus Uhrbacteria bacterium]|jgi:F0F1-type ATP synthase assembly protein I|nr:AtpZ/AtpI family protein [Candidatus Uhrbacteria bacterium]MBT7717460.1 AtpZ/AtpI family protein [Candidatus Uhrbacteria bacterium]